MDQGRYTAEIVIEPEGLIGEPVEDFNRILFKSLAF